MTIFYLVSISIRSSFRLKQQFSNSPSQLTNSPLANNTGDSTNKLSNSPESNKTQHGSYSRTVSSNQEEDMELSTSPDSMADNRNRRRNRNGRAKSTDHDNQDDSKQRMHQHNTMKGLGFLLNQFGSNNSDTMETEKSTESSIVNDTKKSDIEDSTHNQRKGLGFLLASFTSTTSDSQSNLDNQDNSNDNWGKWSKGNNRRDSWNQNEDSIADENHWRNRSNEDYSWNKQGNDRWQSGRSRGLRGMRGNRGNRGHRGGMGMRQGENWQNDPENANTVEIPDNWRSRTWKQQHQGQMNDVRHSGPPVRPPAGVPPGMPNQFPSQYPHHVPGQRMRPPGMNLPVNGPQPLLDQNYDSVSTV